MPTSPGVPGGGRRRHAAGALQRPRRRWTRCSREHGGQIAAHHRRADCRQHGRGAAGRRLPRRACATAARAHGIAADLRRGDLRLPRRGRRRAGSSSACTPDLTCLGKIIGGGLPVGAYGGRADIMRLVAPAGPVYQAGTLSGNPRGDDGGPVGAEAPDAEALQGSGARAARCWRRASPSGARRRRAAAGQRVRLAA